MNTESTEMLAPPTPSPMSLRDLFAAHALAGILAAHSGETALPEASKAARWSREFADAMLLELNNHPFPG